MRLRGWPVVATIALLSASVEAQPANRPRAVAGTVLDSLSGAAAVGARVSIEGTTHASTTDARGGFALAGVAPGSYTLAVRTASLDSLKAVHRVDLRVSDSTPALRIRVPTAAQLTATFCGVTALAHPGIVYGSVDISGETVPPRNVRVVAEWTASTPGSAEGRTNGQGLYRLCGVPLATPVQVRAIVENTNAAPYPVQVPAIGRMFRADLTLDRQLDAGAVLTGVVLIDSTTQPVAGAEVSLPNLAKTVMTNERGAFRIADIPAGEQQLVVRRVGFGPLDTRIAFEHGATVDRRIFLSKIVMLDSVVTRAIRGPLTDFEENRRLGLGHFFTRNELAKQEGRKLADVLATTPGLGVVRGRSGSGWVLSTRPPPSISRRGQAVCPRGSIDDCRARDRTSYTPDPVERQQGIIKACYAQVFVGGILMNPGSPTEPFDVNTVAVDQIEAMEYYASAAQTPIKFSGLNTGCGVLVVHLRQYR